MITRKVNAERQPSSVRYLPGLLTAESPQRPYDPCNYVAYRLQFNLGWRRFGQRTLLAGNVVARSD
jgi:hypothetical protein